MEEILAMRYNYEMRHLILLVFIFMLLSGCAHVVSSEMRDRAGKGIATEELFQNPDAFIGRTVILGGFIVTSVVTDEGSYIEVVQNQLDSRGRPLDRDSSFGRFLIFREGGIDTAIYSAGREVTVAGEVVGKKIRPFGETTYSYPLIRGNEIHLIKESQQIPIHFGIGVWKSF